MIPDTQNYVDDTHQEAQGFAFDASEQMIAQFAWIAQRGRKQGGAKPATFWCCASCPCEVINSYPPGLAGNAALISS